MVLKDASRLVKAARDAGASAQKDRFLGYKLHSAVRENQQEGTGSSGTLSRNISHIMRQNPLIRAVKGTGRQAVSHHTPNPSWGRQVVYYDRQKGLRVEVEGTAER